MLDIVHASAADTIVASCPFCGARSTLLQSQVGSHVSFPECKHKGWLTSVDVVTPAPSAAEPALPTRSAEGAQTSDRTADGGAPPAAAPVVSPDGRFWHDGSVWHEMPGTAATTSAAPSRNIVGACIILAGAGIAALGTFLPWVSASTFGATFSQSGMDALSRGASVGNDALIVLVAAGIALLLAGSVLATTAPRGWNSAVSALATVAGAIAIIIAIYDGTNISNRVGSLSTDLVTASVGVGLYVVGFGGVLMAIGGLTQAGQGRKRI